MPSPFPGMNPYLEHDDVWPDFHGRFITHAADAIAAEVKPAYIVKTDYHIFIRELPAEQRRLVGRGDITLSDLTGPHAASARGAPSSVVAPVYGRVSPAVDIERQSFLEIRDRENRELITVVELLSPAIKKTGPDREQYLSKRRQLLASSTSLLEIDMLRGYPRLPIEGLPDCDYYAMVSRPEERPQVTLWPFLLRDPMPTVPIPLRPGEPDVHLSLQQLMHLVYDKAELGLYVYSNRPQPPLKPEQEKWASEFLPKEY